MIPQVTALSGMEVKCCAITRAGQPCRRSVRGKGYALCTPHVVVAKYGAHLPTTPIDTEKSNG